jgi:GTPase SAR1 family protein
MKFICFVGKDKVGKTTMSKALCDILLTGYRKPTLILSFSEQLRRELIRLYGLPEAIIMNKDIDKKSVTFRLGDYNYDPAVRNMWVDVGLLKSVKEFDDTVITMRELFVTHGTRVCRKLDRYYWSRYFDAKVKQLEEDVSFIICDDARNPDDFEYFTTKDTIIIHVDNNADNGTNAEQDNFMTWLSGNIDKVDKKLEVGIPLLRFTADKLIKTEVIPLLIDRKKPKRVYRDDIFGDEAWVS